MLISSKGNLAQMIYTKILNQSLIETTFPKMRMPRKSEYTPYNKQRRQMNLIAKT